MPPEDKTALKAAVTLHIRAADGLNTACPVHRLSIQIKPPNDIGVIFHMKSDKRDIRCRSVK